MNTPPADILARLEDSSYPDPSHLEPEPIKEAAFETAQVEVLAKIYGSYK